MCGRSCAAAGPATLASVIAAVAPHLPAASAKPGNTPVDREKFLTLCARLEKLLSDSDFASSELAENQGSLLRAGMGERYDALLAAISEFDYAKALACLKTAPGADNAA